MTPADLREIVFAFEYSECRAGWGDKSCETPATLLVDFHPWKRLTCMCAGCYRLYLAEGMAHLPDPQDDRYGLVGVRAYGLPKNE